MLKEDMITLARRAGIMFISDKCFDILKEEYEDVTHLICDIAYCISENDTITESDIYKAIELLGFDITDFN